MPGDDTFKVEAPPVPENDLARVGSLRRLGLLDTAPEERFDRITRIARRLFEVDVALVSLVDIDREWVKSRSGPDLVPVAAESRAANGTTPVGGIEQLIETATLPRDASFGTHAIAERDVLQVPDAALDPRFSDSPLVTGALGVHFYVGTPIASPDGCVIGTLSLFDCRPRTLDEAELTMLGDLAAIVEHEIAVTRLAVDDELTGLTNRRGFVTVGSQALAFCERQDVDALVVLAAVDGLAMVDERGGRSAGEQLLRLAASAMADTFRSSDVVGRVGDDQFAAVLTGFEGTDSQVAHRLLTTVAACNLELERTTFGLSMTVGSARFSHRDPELIEVLMHRAEASQLAGGRLPAQAEGA